MGAVQKVAYDYGREEQHVDRPEGRHEEKDVASAMDDRTSKEEQNFVTSTMDDRSSKEEQNLITPQKTTNRFRRNAITTNESSRRRTRILYHIDDGRKPSGCDCNGYLSPHNNIKLGEKLAS